MLLSLYALSSHVLLLPLFETQCRYLLPQEGFPDAPYQFYIPPFLCLHSPLCMTSKSFTNWWLRFCFYPCGCLWVLPSVYPLVSWRMGSFLFPLWPIKHRSHLNTCSCMKHGMSSSLLVHMMLVTSHILWNMAYFNFSLSSLVNQILRLPLKKYYHRRSKSSWQTGVKHLGMYFSVGSISLATFLLYIHGALCLKHI